MAEQLDLNPEDSPFEFPCRFPIKVMGEKDSDIEKFVKETLEKELKDSSDMDFKSRLSTGEKFISVTATFTANNKAELDKIYEILSADKRVKYLL